MTLFYSTLLTAGVSIRDQFMIRPGVPVNNLFPTIHQLVATILPNAYILAGLILFFLLIFGGFTIIMNQGNTEELDKGKKIIGGAILGFLLIFASYWIIQIIQVITGVPILNPPATF